MGFFKNDEKSVKLNLPDIIVEDRVYKNIGHFTAVYVSDCLFEVDLELVDVAGYVSNITLDNRIFLNVRLSTNDIDIKKELLNHLCGRHRSKEGEVFNPDNIISYKITDYREIKE